MKSYKVTGIFLCSGTDTRNATHNNSPLIYLLSFVQYTSKGLIQRDRLLLACMGLVCYLPRKDLLKGLDHV